MMYLHERFQAHCSRCFKIFEDNSIESVLKKVQAHEQESARLVSEDKMDSRTHELIDLPGIPVEPIIIEQLTLVPATFNTTICNYNHATIRDTRDSKICPGCKVDTSLLTTQS